LRRSRGAGARGAVAGGVRLAGDAAAPRGTGAGRDAPALAGAPSGAGDARPRLVLARGVLRRAQGPARSLSEAPLAGRPAHRAAVGIGPPSRPLMPERTTPRRLPGRRDCAGSGSTRTGCRA